jgi:hypothetical protein
MKCCGMPRITSEVEVEWLSPIERENAVLNVPIQDKQELVAKSGFGIHLEELGRA